MALLEDQTFARTEGCAIHVTDQNGVIACIMRCRQMAFEPRQTARKDRREHGRTAEIGLQGDDADRQADDGSAGYATEGIGASNSTNATSLELLSTVTKNCSCACDCPR